MLQFELANEIHATAESVWDALSTLSEWSTWNRLVPHALGQLVVGSTLHLKVRGPDGEVASLDPLVLSVIPPRELVLEAHVGSRRVLTLSHTFSIESIGYNISVLRQCWLAAEPLDENAWSVVCDRLARWIELGDDLAAYLAEKGQPPSRVVPA